MNNKHKKKRGIQQKFSKIMIISAILQVFIVIIVYEISKIIYIDNISLQINKELLLKDYNISEIAKQKYLNNDYALQVQLYAYQTNQDLNLVTFISVLPRNLNFNNNCSTYVGNRVVCNDGNGMYHGYIPVIFDNKILGYIQTEKIYPEYTIYNLPQNIFYATMILIILILVINFLLISLSIRKYIKIDLQKLIIFIDSDRENFDYFIIKEHDEIAHEMSIAKNKNKLLQAQIMKQKVERVKVDIINQVTHNIRSPLAVLQIIFKNQESKLTTLERNQFRTVINDISGLIHELTLKTENSFKIEDKNNLPRYINIYASLLTTINNKLLELNNDNCDIQLIIENNLIENVWIYAAPYLFNSVVSNLLNNSYEAINNTKKVIIVKLNTHGNVIRFVIQDNGRGIPFELISDIRSGMSLNGGNGIGLSSSIKYIESIGGDLTIKPIINMRIKEIIGTKVTIKLPIVIPQFLIPFKIDFAAKLIVIDDDIAVHQTWRKFTKQHNLNTMHFTNPDEFIKWYKINPDENNYYFIDYYFSNSSLNGINISSQITSNYKFIVTNDYDSLNLQEYCIKNKISIIPKIYLLKQFQIYK